MLPDLGWETAPGDPDAPASPGGSGQDGAVAAE